MDDIKVAKQAIVVGGGFIGFEMCDMLKMAGLDVTLLIREKYFWEPLLDEASAKIIETAMTAAGVNIRYQTEVAEVIGEQAVSGVKLKDGSTLPADLIMVGIGTQPVMDWVTKAGVVCNRGIVANEFLQTNIPNIWTAGDVAEYQDMILDERIQFGDWVNAQVQGRVAALNMTGQHQAFHLVSFYTAQGFHVAIAFVGDIRLTPERSVIARGDPANGAATRIVIAHGKIIGATMINRTADLNPIAHVIEHQVDVTHQLEHLHDPTFDMQSLIPPTP